jgi:hypothetical protein
LVDGLGKLVAHRGADFVIGPADEAIGGSLAPQVGNRFNVAKVGHLAKKSLMVLSAKSLSHFRVTH